MQSRSQKNVCKGHVLTITVILNYTFSVTKHSNDCERTKTRLTQPARR
jgi:hypothetical protein